MATKQFSGNSNYQLIATASVSGGVITVTTQVKKTDGYGYEGFDNDYLWRTVIDGTTYNDDWGPYSFVGSTPKTITLGSKSKSGLSAGARSWSVTVQAGSSLGSATVSGSITVPPDDPAAPTIGTPVRGSDSSQTVHWTRNATTAAPYTSQQIQRRVFNGEWSAWAAIATISTGYTTSAAMSRADNGTTSNRVYQYRVKASNSAGSATSSSSVAVYTTPGAPSAVAAVKTSAGGIKLTITQTVPHVSYETEVQYSTNGGSSWSALTTLASGVTQYTWASPPSGQTVVFRARVVNDTTNVGDNLASAWRTSNSVPLSAPPAAPTQLAPNGVAFDVANPQAFTWQYNSTDTSEQTQFQIRARLVGAGTWTEHTAVSWSNQVAAFATTFTRLGITPTNGQSYEWQVRTWGVNATAGAWSATATFGLSEPPDASIVAPDTTLAASLLTVEWTYFDTESTAQSRWEASLSLDGEILEARSGSGEDTSATFSTRLTDATEYQVSVRVRDGAGVWSAWDTSTFTTDFPAPSTPTITLSWAEEQGTVIVDITNPAGGPVEAVSNDIYWSVDGETWILAVEGAAINTPTADPTAPVGVLVDYKVVAWSDLPSSAESAPVTIVTPGTVGYWSAGDGFETSVVMEYGNGAPPRVDFTSALHDKTLHYFAGRTFPVEFTGTARDRSGQVSFLITTPDQLQKIRELAFLPAPHLIRLPDGTSLYASIGDVRDSRVTGDYYDISVPITEVRR